MPTVTEQPTVAYAHCPDPRCPGSEQVEVQAIRRETSLTYIHDLGGDIPGVERSDVTPVFANDDDAACQHCAPARAREKLEPRLRELSFEPRKQYQPLSGFDPNYLVQPDAQPFDPSVRNTAADEEVAALRAQVDRLSALVESRGAAE